MEQEYRTFEQVDLSGGLNNSIDPAKLDTRFMIVMENFYYDPVKRVITKRNGYTAWTGTAVDAGDRGKALFRFYRKDDPDILVAGYMDDINNGTVKYYKSASSDWVALSGTNKNDRNGNYFFAQMNNILIVCNGETNHRPTYFLNDSSDRLVQLGVEHPQVGTVALATATGGDLSAGTYKFLFTYRVAGVEFGLDYEGPPGRDNDPDLEISANTSDKIAISNLPTDRPSFQENQIRIYRTRANGTVYYFDHKVNIGISGATSTKGDDALGEELDAWDNYWAPFGKYPCVFKDRLFLGNGHQNAYIREMAQMQDIGGNSTLWFSKVASPASFPLQNYINFAPDDGDEIKGVYGFAGKLFVFKERKHFTLTFSTDPLNGYVEQYLPGLVSDRSPAVCGVRPNFPQGALIWLARDKRVYLHDGVRARSISDPVQATLDGLSLTQLSNAVGAWYPDRSWYMLSLDTTGNNRNDITLVFDLDTGSWHSFDYGFSCVAYFGGAGDNNELVAGSINETGGFDVYQLDTGTTDAGNAISATLTTPLIGFGNSNITKQLRKFYIEVKCDNAQAANIDIYGNRETTTLQSLSLTGDGTEGQHKAFSLDVTPKNYYRFKLTANSPTIFEINRYGFVYLLRREEYSLMSMAGGVGPGEKEAS